MLIKNINKLSLVLLNKIKPIILALLLLIIAGNFFTNIIHAASFPSLKVEPKTIQFGSLEVGSSSSSRTITITNNVDSTNVLTLFEIYLSGADANNFSIVNDNCSGKILDGSMSSTLELVFNPTSIGSKSATLMITSNATVKPFEVDLSGIGIASDSNQTSRSAVSEKETGPTNNQTSTLIDNSSETSLLFVLLILFVVGVIIFYILAKRRLKRQQK